MFKSREDARAAVATMTTTWKPGDRCEALVSFGGDVDDTRWMPATIAEAYGSVCTVDVDGVIARGPIPLSTSGVRRPSVPDVASASPDLVLAWMQYLASVVSAQDLGWDGGETMDARRAVEACESPGNLRALYDAVQRVPWDRRPDAVRVAMDGVTGALMAQDREGAPDVSPWRVGDPAEIQRGSGEWRSGTVARISPGMDGEPIVCVRYEREGAPHEGTERWDSEGLRRPLAKAPALSEAWAIGDRCEVQGGRWYPATVDGVEGDMVHVRLDCSPDSAFPVVSAIVRRPLTKPSADQTPAPAETWPAISERLGDAVEAIRASPAASHWPSLCGCGAPAYESLLSRECSRGSECPVVAGEPEPDEVSDGWWLGPNETGWKAMGQGRGAAHPTREGAIAAWRDRVRGGR